MVTSHHFSGTQLAKGENAVKRLVFGLNPSMVHRRKSGHLVLKNVTIKKRSATKTRQRDTANRRIVWWSKSREEPLARKTQRRPVNQDQILRSGIIGSTQFSSGAMAPLFFYPRG